MRTPEDQKLIDALIENAKVGKALLEKQEKDLCNCVNVLRIAVRALKRTRISNTKGSFLAKRSLVISATYTLYYIKKLAEACGSPQWLKGTEVVPDGVEEAAIAVDGLPTLNSRMTLTGRISGGP